MLGDKAANDEKSDASVGSLVNEPLFPNEAGREKGE